MRDIDGYDFLEINDRVHEDIQRDLNAPMVQDFSNIRDNPDFAEFFLVPEKAKDYPKFYRETIKTTPSKPWLFSAAALAFVSALALGILGFGIGTGMAFFQENSTAVGGNASVFTGTSPSFEPIILEPVVAGLSDVVELIAPSVVSVTTFRDEWEFPFNTTSYGSGIVFADSYDRIFIATSLYVVWRGYRWDISISGSDPISAHPVNSNPDYDLAVVYVYKQSLLDAGIDTVSFATFGNSDDMRLGEVVLAIGNAMGEGVSVTRGIISAAQREVHLPGRRYPINVIQTDAAINYGNSGGPLINTQGEIVGININQSTGLIISPREYELSPWQRQAPREAEGMAYSISSNVAAPILAELVATYRTPAIGIIGVSLSDCEYNMADYWGIPELGVRVISVQQGRPAYLAGIRPNDIITGFDDRPIFDMQQLVDAIRSKEIGDTAEVRILRGGTFAITVQVELAMMIRETF